MNNPLYKVDCRGAEGNGVLLFDNDDVVNIAEITVFGEVVKGEFYLYQDSRGENDPDTSFQLYQEVEILL